MSSQAISTINVKYHFLVRDSKVNKAQRGINELKEERRKLRRKIMTSDNRI